ncbi:MAG TPA: hypothetical protein VMF14_07355 [Solirubrobacteraceae bacterium]|nr:hypothetical protein [Solirubrobacteraceae bacterium]
MLSRRQPQRGARRAQVQVQVAPAFQETSVGMPARGRCAGTPGAMAGTANADGVV